MESNIKNLNQVKGKVLVFGGVYSNLQALEAFYQKAQELNIDSNHIICTGDIVAYCAQPVECINFIKDWGIHCIAGNVEMNLVDDVDDCGCNFEDGSRCDVFSRQWYPYLKSKITADDLVWMQEMPHYLSFAYADKKVFVLHGGYPNTSEFIFKSTPWEVKQNIFDASNADVILAGHCGIPFADTQGDKLWLNAGVIGLPANDGKPEVWYALLDDENEKLSFRICQLDYDFEIAAQMMEGKPLPQTYTETIRTGIWDNCEILPEKEAKEQGLNLILD